MTDYTNIIYSGVSIIIEIAIGFICFKLKFFPEETITKLNAFLVNVCYLPLITRALATRDLGSLSFLPFLVAILAVITVDILLLVVFCIKKFKNRFYIYLSTYLPSVYVNYLIIGLPVFKAVWSENENAMVSVQNLSGDLFVVPVYLVLTKFYSINQANIKHKEANDGIVEHVQISIIWIIIKGIITNKFIIGNAIGFIYAATGWKMCPFLGQLMKYLGDAVLALALFTVGGFLSQHSIIACNFLHFLITLIIRAIVFPWIVAMYCFFIKVSPRLARQCMIMATMPTATAAFLLSEQNRTGAGVASTMILWSTITAIPCVVLWFYLLDHFGIFVE
ncbi:Auxin Efflux Carrier family protein [Histomonas meleagridis]|uniref:Auxin Efflux Carrier family protein n=1 Tax=Histomonas meleagridis TaxID=135588 RepID=UPI00355A4652|nr:Auxin Efflux Carrier family protein [Histomonas meleagridis]KAH0796193.1 Auxin Efflux Carrier family protein [Histomonas meleagridis]